MLITGHTSISEFAFPCDV